MIYLIDSETKRVREVNCEIDGSRIECIFSGCEDQLGYNKKKNLQVGPKNGYYCYRCKAKGLALTEEEYHKSKHNRYDYAPTEKWDANEWLNNDYWQSFDNFSDNDAEPHILWNEIIREHVYTDENSVPIQKKTYYKTSDGKKRPIQYRYENGEWKTGLTYNDGKKVKQLPYNLPNILKQDTIIYVEGEKDCDTLIDMSIKNVTTLGSSGVSLAQHQIKYFRGKDIIIIPDADAVGYKFARKIGKQLCPIANSVSICFLRGLPPVEGADVTDWIEANPKGKEALLSVPKEKCQLYFTEILRLSSVPFMSAKQLFKYEQTESELISYMDVVAKYKNFPVSIFPYDIQQYIKEVSESMYVPQDWIAGSILAASGSMLGSRVILNTGFGEWEARPYISFIIVNPNGSKKSHPIQKVLEYIFEVDRQEEVKYRIDCRHYRSMEYSKKTNPQKPLLKEPIRKRYYVADITIEQLCKQLENNPQGLLWYVDEIAGLIKGLGQYKGGSGNDMERCIDILDGRSFPVSRKDFDLYVSKPFVSALGTTHPDTIANIMRGCLLDNGFAYRFNFCCLERNIPKVSHSIPATTKAMLTSYFASLNGLKTRYKDESDDIKKHIDPYIFTLEDDAKERALNILNIEFVALFGAFGEDSLIAGILSKIETTFVNCCLLLHCIQNYRDIPSKKKIELNTVEQAYRLAMYFAYHNYKTLSKYGNSENDIYYHKIKNYSQKEKTDVISIRILQQYVFQKHNKQQIIDILLGLEKAGNGYFVNGQKEFKLL